LKKIVSKEGVITHNEPASKRKKVLDESICKEVIKAMRFTTKSGGSAQLADIPGFTEVGKTSTSEKLIGGKYSKSKHVSTFVGFAPANDPKFVLFVAVDEPEKMFIPGFGTTHFGGKCAAPIFREIGKRSLEYLGDFPDDKDNSQWRLEVKQLNELYERYNETKKAY
jgi:cell division protein FtsI (penicillin-binding protein 3)